MQVYTFSKYIRCKDDVIIILFSFPVGIKILADSLKQLAAVLG